MYNRTLLPKTIILVMLAVTTFSADTFAKEIFFGEQQQLIPIVFGKETLFRFAKPVKTISNASKFNIKPVDKNEPDYKLLSVKPRRAKGKNSVSFILSDGTTIRTKLKIVSPNTLEKTANLYEFKSKEVLINSPEEKFAAGNFSELDLLKAMIRGDLVSGYRVRKVRRSIYTGHKGIKVILLRVYTGDKFNGYIFRLENVSKKSQYQIDIRKLRLGNPDLAVLSQIDDSLLSPAKKGKEFTYLRVVAKSTSIYNDIVLPVIYIKGGKK